MKMAADKKPLARLRGVWATLAVLALAVLAWSSPALAAGLIYDRTLILEGEWWRIWTGHIVHFGRSHLFWDLMVFLPTACWLEHSWPKLARWFFVGCPLAISAGLLVFAPGLGRYAGLSGLATGVVVLLAGQLLRTEQGGRRWLLAGVLALVGAKIGHELVSGAPLVVTDFGDKVRTVPLAHLGGALCGLAGLLAGGMRPARGRANRA